MSNKEKENKTIGKEELLDIDCLGLAQGCIARGEEYGAKIIKDFLIKSIKQSIEEEYKKGYDQCLEDLKKMHAPA